MKTQKWWFSAAVATIKKRMLQFQTLRLTSILYLRKWDIVGKMAIHVNHIKIGGKCTELIEALCQQHLFWDTTTLEAQPRINIFSELQQSTLWANYNRNHHRLVNSCKDKISDIQKDPQFTTNGNSESRNSNHSSHCNGVEDEPNARIKILCISKLRSIIFALFQTFTASFIH